MIAWVDAGFGASGDMILGALVGAGVELELLRRAVDAVAPGAVELTAEHTRRAGLAATRVLVRSRHPRQASGLSAIRALLESATATGDLNPIVASHATQVFALLARAEGRVHDLPPEEVHFHELAEWDTVADVVAACAGLVELGVTRLHVSPVAVGSGSVPSQHGLLPVPVPAVVELLRGVPTFTGPAGFESCTPTGAALLRHWATEWGPQPLMLVDQIGIGAGRAEAPSHPNCLRLLVGQDTDEPIAPTEPMVLLECNIDDMDPRLLPHAISLAIAAGAADAWATPIVMKKGRAAHVLSVLASRDNADDLASMMLTETSAIGLRRTDLQRTALERHIVSVEVAGHALDVKVAWLGASVVNVQPEFDQVTALARELGKPAKWVLSEAAAAARSVAHVPVPRPEPEA